MTGSANRSGVLHAGCRNFGNSSYIRCVTTETIGQRLRRFRLEAGMSQRDLAEPLYTHAYVSTVEGGKRKPSRPAVEHFAGRLGKDVDEILTGRPPNLSARLDLELQEARRAVSAGYLDDATEAFEEVRDEARLFDLKRLEARAQQGLALCCELRGNLDEAIVLYEIAQQTLHGEPPNIAAEAIAGHARCLQMRGENRTAIYLLEHALETLQQEGLTDPDALVRLHTSLVAAYFEQGAHGKAAASAEAALEFAPRATNPEHQASMHLNVARIFLAQGRADDCHASLRRAEELFHALDLRQEIARCHLSRGYILSREGKLEEARRELEKAAEGFEKANAPIMTARTRTELARAQRLAGEPVKAKEMLQEALTLLQADDIFDLGEVYRELGLCYLDSDATEAERCLREACVLFERAEQTGEYALTSRILGDLLESRGDASGAIEAYRAGLAAVEESLDAA